MADPQVLNGVGGDPTDALAPAAGLAADGSSSGPTPGQASPSTTEGPSSSATRPPRSHRVSILMGVAALVILAGLLVAAAFALSPESSSHPERIVFVGDSITDQARTALTAALPSDDAVDIQAVPGRKFAEMLPFAQQAAATNPDEAVINLGSNDVLLGEQDDVTDAAMASMFSAFARTPCVTLVTVNKHFIFGADQADHAERINVQLRQAAAAHGWSIVDWNKIVEDDQAAGSPLGPITADSVHPTAVGQHLLIDAIRSSLDACRAGPANKTA